MLDDRQDKVLQPCYCLEERRKLSRIGRVRFPLTVSMLPRCNEYKDHLRSKSSSGLGSKSSSRAIETADATAFPSRYMIADYVALREEMNGRRYLRFFPGSAHTGYLLTVLWQLSTSRQVA